MREKQLPPATQSESLKMHLGHRLCSHNEWASGFRPPFPTFTNHLATRADP